MSIVQIERLQNGSVFDGLLSFCVIILDVGFYSARMPHVNMGNGYELDERVIHSVNCRPNQQKP